MNSLKAVNYFILIFVLLNPAQYWHIMVMAVEFNWIQVANSWGLYLTACNKDPTNHG
jgi:hypothetical protein